MGDGHAFWMGKTLSKGLFFHTTVPEQFVTFPMTTLWQALGGKFDGCILCLTCGGQTLNYGDTLWCSEHKCINVALPHKPSHYHFPLKSFSIRIFAQLAHHLLQQYPMIAGFSICHMGAILLNTEESWNFAEMHIVTSLIASCIISTL